MPIIGFLFAASREVVLVVLGPQWVEVVPIFQYLMPAAFVGTFNVATGWVFQSLGQTDRQFKSGLVGTGLRIAAFLYFARWGGSRDGYWLFDNRNDLVNTPPHILFPQKSSEFLGLSQNNFLSFYRINMCGIPGDARRISPLLI